MHRPGIASVSGAKIILDGTTIEEVKKYHRETLVLCVDLANQEEAKYLERKRREKDRKREQTEAHRRSVENLTDDLFFD